MFTFSDRFSRLFVASKFSRCLSAILLLACCCFAQRSSEAVALELRQPVTRELQGLQEHLYSVKLNEGQYAKLIFEQRGVDAVVQVLGDDNKSILDFDLEMRPYGEETVQLVAPASGIYRLLVRGKYLKLPAGSYSLRLAEVRDAADNDRLLDQARRLQTASWQHRMAGKFAEGIVLGEKALELQERILGPDHAELAFTLFAIAVNSEFNVDYPKAEAFYLRGQTVAEKALGADHPLLARGLSSAAYHYFQHRGDYSRADQLYRRGLSIREKAFGPEHPEVAKSVKDLGLLNIDIGDYVTAEAYLQRAITINKKSYGEEHVEVALSESYLGGVYMQKGDYEKAEPLFLGALAYWEKAFGVDSGWANIGVTNLANLYLTMGDLDRAEPLLIRSIAINEKWNNAEHPSVLTGRHALAELYLKKGNVSKAESVSSGLLAALEKVLGPAHRTVGMHSHVLGRIRLIRKDLSGAEAHSRRALSVLEAAAGPNYHVLAEVLLDLGNIAIAHAKWADAVALQKRANEIVDYNLNVNLATGSERQKLAYLATLPEQTDQAISLAQRMPAENRSAVELAASAILLRKGRVQDAMSNSVGALRDRFNTDDRLFFDRLNILSAQLARLVLDGPQDAALSDHQKRIKDLEDQREKLEGEISRRSAGFYQIGPMNRLSAVQAAVGPDDALVEFALYRPFDAKKTIADPRAEPRYIAFVLRRNSEVQLKDLGPAGDINDSVDRLRQAIRDPRRKDARELARTLDEKVMQPIRQLVATAKHLLISPDGELNLIPFEAFVDEGGKHLVESFSFSYLTTGRDLVRMQTARASKGPATVIANPVFGEPGPDSLLASTSRVKQVNLPKRRSITNTRNLSETYFAPLAGTAREAVSIKTLFPDMQMLTGASATETAVKELAAPRILHIATHGFFLNDQGIAENKNRMSSGNSIGGSKIENPLLRSGLAFAGANRRSGEEDDGILTALEASGLNLWGTKLVVLSACDTGVGEIRNGEGVYGLRRSFVLAGAESLVMSLWPVSDYVTRELMTNYYRNLKNGLGRGEALRQVQLSMIRNPNRRHPFYWASFIQSGEWANLNGKR